MLKFNFGQNYNNRIGIYVPKILCGTHRKLQESLIYMKEKMKLFEKLHIMHEFHSILNYTQL